MLDEKVKDSGFDLAEFRQLRHHFTRNDVKSAAARLESNDALNPGHKTL
jgi:hypothetical protein